MPEHDAWLPWIMGAMALAGAAHDTQLLMSVVLKRQKMLAEHPSGVDVFLRLHHAIALGLGSDAASAALRAAFDAACAVKDIDAPTFVRTMIPLKAPFGPRVRAAASLALGLVQSPAEARAESNASRERYGRIGGDMFASARMLSLANGRSDDEKAAAVVRASAAICTWEAERAATDAMAALQLKSSIGTADVATAAAAALEVRLHSSSEQTAEAIDAVWMLEGAFSSSECDLILQALHTVTSVRGWDRDRHGNHPTTDLPISAVPEVEAMIREALFVRVLRPLAAHYLPPPVLPEHLEMIDLFYVKYSAAAGEQAGLNLHTDGSLFSFNVLLNDPADFEGGGTHFEPTTSAPHTCRPTRGSAVAHSGHVEHAGLPITSGERYILVGFVGCVTYPYTKSLAAHNERDAYGKFGGSAWDRSPTAVATAVPCVPVGVV